MAYAVRLQVALAIALFALYGCGEYWGNPEQLLGKARQERENGNYSTAIIHLKNVLQKLPDHAEAYFLLGASYADSGNAALAETTLRKSIELGFDKTKVFPELGKVLLQKGEFQKALDEIAVGEESGPADQAEILSLRAVALIGLNRRAEARGLLEEALALQPQYSNALLARARLYVGDGKLDEAARQVEGVIAGAPANAEAWLTLGDLLRFRADRPGALKAYQKAFALSPNNIPSRLAMAQLHIDAGDFEEAGKQLGEVRKLDPRNFFANYMQALIEFRRQSMAASRRSVSAALAAAPDHVPSLLLAGAVEDALGAHIEAQSYLGQVLARAPGNLYARRLLISSMLKSGRAVRALEVLRPGLRQAPEDPTLLALTGEALLQTGQYAKASVFFEQATRLEPKNPGSQLGLGLSRLAAGDAGRALASLESAVELDSASYHADVILVTWHLNRGNHDLALKALEKLESKQPNNPLTYNLKAAAYGAKKDFAAARRNLIHALELQPTYVQAAVNLALLDLQDKNPVVARGRLTSILERDKNNVQALLALAKLAPGIGATPKEVINWLERAAAASSNLVQPKLLLARAYAQFGEFNNAIELAQRTLASDPENPESLDTLGSIQLAAGEMDRAIASFERVTLLQPQSPLALYRLANAQAAASDRGAAASTLKKALSLKPDYREALMALADLEIQGGDFAAALKIARQLKAKTLSLTPDLEFATNVPMMNMQQSTEPASRLDPSGVILIKLHKALVRAGKPVDAGSRLTQWLKESPDDLALRLYAGDFSLESRNYRDAILHYEQVLRKQSDNPMALNNLAVAYHQAKDPRSTGTAERAYKLRPDRADIMDTLGWILTEQGKIGRGIELLQNAVAAVPDAPLIRYHLAQALLKTGEKARARAELERIESKEYRFAEQAEAMKLLKQLRD